MVPEGWATGMREGTERMGVQISKRLLNGIKPDAQEYFIWDSTLLGFGVRVRPSGSSSYVVKYRAGSGRKAPTRRLTIGKVGVITPEEARLLAKKTLGSVAHGNDPAEQRSLDRKTLSLEEAGDRFLAEFIDQKRSPKTASSYRDVLVRLVYPALRSRQLTKVTTSEIRILHAKMAKAPYQANRMLATLSSLYSYAQKHDLAPKEFNPCRGIEHYREMGRERFLTMTELGALGEALREAETVGLPPSIDHGKRQDKHSPKEEVRLTVIGEHAAAAIRLLILTGARLREILHLRWNEVDLERGLLFLPQSKTGKKTITLNAPAVSILEGLTKTGVYVIASPSTSSDREKPRSDLKRPWGAIIRRAGLWGVRIHDLRHTHASIGAGAGLGLPIIGKLLGHTEATTTSRYAHLDANPLRQASELIAANIAAAMGEPSKR